MKLKEVLNDIYQDKISNEDFIERAYGIIQEEGIYLKLSFDGYFNPNYKSMANSLFDEEYFENKDRIRLYVYCCAICDNSIYEALEYAHSLLGENIDKNILCSRINQIGYNGTTFITNSIQNIN